MGGSPVAGMTVCAAPEGMIWVVTGLRPELEYQHVPAWEKSSCPCWSPPAGTTR
jgi:hypothetical protein